MTPTIKTFENRVKELQKKLDKCDCLATAQPYIRKKEVINSTIRTAKGLEKAVKDAQHNLDALTNTVNQLVEQATLDVQFAKAHVVDAKDSIKSLTELIKIEGANMGDRCRLSAMNIELAVAKTQLATSNEALVKAKEALKKVKAERTEKIAEYKKAIEDAKEALKNFLAGHANELED